MAYATVDQIRTRYLRLGVDEFTDVSDDELQQALDSASLEIDRCRPAGDLTDQAKAILADVCMTIARMLAHAEQWVSLDANYPPIRDALNARAWLNAIAKGDIPFPPPAADGTDGNPGEFIPSGPNASAVALTRTAIYDSAFESAYAQ